MRFPLIVTLEGIVLNRRNIGESDRLITLFPKEKGKVRVLARGIRKIGSRRAGHLEVFSRAAVTIHKGRELDTLSEASGLGDQQTWESLSQIAGAYYVCELIDVLLPIEQEHADVYALLLQTLRALQRGKEKQEETLYFIPNKIAL